MAAISVSQAPPTAPPAHVSRPPEPPKAQSDHKPASPPTAAHGPAVVLSGAVAKPPEAPRQQTAGADQGKPGAHVNRVI